MKCPECGSTNYGNTNNETICKDCGLVLDDEQFDELQNTRSVIPPQLRVAGTTERGGRIVKAQTLLSTRQKTQINVKRTIVTVASQQDLPRYVEQEAIDLYMDASHKNITQGREGTALAYACIYAACLIHEVPRTPFEMTAYSAVRRSQMLRSYKKIMQVTNRRMVAPKASDLVPRFATRLRLHQRTVERAISLLQREDSTDCRPETRAAAALYYAALIEGEPVTQRLVANSTGVIEVTIRKRMKELRKYESL